MSPYIALKAITDWAAWQYPDEASRDTPAAGKLADLVLLDRSPPEGDPSMIEDIKVVETTKQWRND